MDGPVGQGGTGWVRWLFFVCFFCFFYYYYFLQFCNVVIKCCLINRKQIKIDHKKNPKHTCFRSFYLVK